MRDKAKLVFEKIALNRSETGAIVGAGIGAATTAGSYFPSNPAQAAELKRLMKYKELKGKGYKNLTKANEKFISEVKATYKQPLDLAGTRRNLKINNTLSSLEKSIALKKLPVTSKAWRTASRASLGALIGAGALALMSN